MSARQPTPDEVAILAASLLAAIKRARFRIFVCRAAIFGLSVFQIILAGAFIDDGSRAIGHLISLVLGCWGAGLACVSTSWLLGGIEWSSGQAPINPTAAGADVQADGVVVSGGAS